jgi:hypothetical protein
MGSSTSKQLSPKVVCAGHSEKNDKRDACTKHIRQCPNVKGCNADCINCIRVRKEKEAKAQMAVYAILSNCDYGL